MSTASVPDKPLGSESPLPKELWPRTDHLVTEDDTPVDNVYSEKQQRLLTEPLYSSWHPGSNFVAAANVGVFYSVREPPQVPDAFIAIDVQLPEKFNAREHRSYFIWEYGKPPDVVVEVVSNKEGGEADEKMRKYARWAVQYYVIYDPMRAIQTEPLRVFTLRERTYAPCSAEWLPLVGLGLTLWKGRFENWGEDVWLRWCDRDGKVIQTGAERAEEERERAERERQRAERLREQLQRLGASPDDLSTPRNGPSV